jgi:hypothetical protein
MAFEFNTETQGPSACSLRMKRVVLSKGCALYCADCCLQPRQRVKGKQLSAILGELIHAEASETSRKTHCWPGKPSLQLAGHTVCHTVCHSMSHTAVQLAAGVDLAVGTAPVRLLSRVSRQVTRCSTPTPTPTPKPPPLPLKPYPLPSNPYPYLSNLQRMYWRRCLW